MGGSGAKSCQETEFQMRLLFFVKTMLSEKGAAQSPPESNFWQLLKYAVTPISWRNRPIALAMRPTTSRDAVNQRAPGRCVRSAGASKVLWSYAMSNSRWRAPAESF